MLYNLIKDDEMFSPLQFQDVQRCFLGVCFIWSSLLFFLSFYFIFSTHFDFVRMFDLNGNHVTYVQKHFQSTMYNDLTISTKMTRSTDRTLKITHDIQTWHTNMIETQTSHHTIRDCKIWRCKKRYYQKKRKSIQFKWHTPVLSAIKILMYISQGILHGNIILCFIT